MEAAGPLGHGRRRPGPRRWGTTKHIGVDPASYKAPTGLAQDSDAKSAALSWIAAHGKEIIGLSDDIWRYAEPSLREWNSSRAVAAFLDNNGLTGA
jgi:aminobenzoyl-glutamate utilization protein B